MSDTIGTPFAIVPCWVAEAAISAQAVRLYVVLARYRNAGSTCFPSRATLAAACHCSLDTVDRAMKELVEFGCVIADNRRASTGRQTSNRYQLLDGPAPGRTDAAPPDLAFLPDRAASLRPTPAAPVRHHELEKEGTRNTHAQSRPIAHPFDADFEVAWEAYPRHRDRGRAFSTYTARRREGAGAEDLLLAVKHYAAAVNGSEERYIKHAATFFGPSGTWREWLDPSSATPADRDWIEGLL